MTIANHTSEIDSLLVKRLWNNEECPYFDLIMFADGKIFPLQPLSDSDCGTIILKSNSWIPASQIAGIDISDNLNEGFASLYHKDLSESDLTISCGECCSSGENGFISLINSSSGDLIWLVFLVSSNPFSSVDVDKDEIIAHSTDGRKFRLNLENPDSVEIISAGGTGSVPTN
ncbi:hypothetical protein [Massilia rubra]|uniref:Uncharacterized protein n=1 Tax=Massilia rubra TaxID=2607910 RepID=A0ABX0LSU8_9BURK|nr:hypothetical protein [Massilia rubra]NHZ37583.1 hypothetical protein [Massilia rubra]